MFEKISAKWRRPRHSIEFIYFHIPHSNTISPEDWEAMWNLKPLVTNGDKQWNLVIPKKDKDFIPTNFLQYLQK